MSLDIGSNSVSLARDLINGNQQKCGSSGEIQQFKVIGANAQGHYSYHMLATSLLKHTIMEASYAFINTNGKMTHEKRVKIATSRQALAFIAGTGLDIMLQTYGIEYDPEELRESFFAIFHIKHT